MLQINNLTIYMKKDLRTLIDDFSFSLQTGDKVGLIGEEGNGKSVLLKAIAEPKSLAKDFEIQGSIHKDNEIIAYLPQLVEVENINISTQDYFQQKFPYAELDWTLYYELLQKLDFPPDRINTEITIRQLSGGEKIKFFLLIELLKHPTLLLLDEPTNDLDLDSILMLEKLIKEIDIPLIFVSHDEELLENCANSIIHLEQLHHKTRPHYNIARLKYSEYVTAKKEKITRQSKLAKKEQEEFDKKLQRYNDIFNSVQHDLRAIEGKQGSDKYGRLLAKKMKQVKSQEKRFEKERTELTKKPETEDPILLSFFPDVSLPPNKEILRLDLHLLKASEQELSRNIRLDIIGPEKICIIGANGSGKTTLLRQIICQLKKNHINYGYMPQDYSDRMDPEGSAVDFLSETYTKEEHTRVRTFLGCLNFTADEMLRPISTLSGGQRAKIFFSQMILNKAEFLVLDEPTRNLSPLSGPEIRKALNNYRGGILAVSHDRRFIKDVFDKVMFLDKNGLEEISIHDIGDRRSAYNDQS